MKKVKKKTETKEKIEERVRKEEREKYSYEKKRSSNTITIGVIGAIVGMFLYYGYERLWNNIQWGKLDK